MEKPENEQRNHQIGPRNVFNTTRIYRVYILKRLIEDKSLYGKQIRDALIEHFEDYNVPISYGTIYDTLHSLEREGQIDSHWDTINDIQNRNKRYYTITDKGLTYYKTLSLQVITALKENERIVERYIDLLTK